MDTLARLREIVRGSGAARRPAAVPVRELTYEPVGADGLPPERATVSGPLEEARHLATPYGEALVVDRTFEAGAPHGRARVEEGDLLDREALAILTGHPVPEAGVKPSPVFFDLETTGLSGGAGTVAFLVGCGWYEDGAFRTRQFFLPGFAAERALLHAVGEFLDGVPLLVTYNGRTFDLPIMETRWALHRMPAAADGVPHVDMLPPARRLWREALDGEARSCRLVALEASLLGFLRTGDVPGWEIPQRYFDYVRRGDTRALGPVLHHNRLDLLSLAVLAARAQRLVRKGPAAARDARECCALGHLLGRAGRTAEAETAYRAATDHPAGDAAARQHAWRALALLLRRERRHREAASAWRRVLASGPGGAAREAVEALAIHHEHRERDLDLARALAVRALESEPDPRRQAAVRHRLARLERKLGTVGARPSAGGVLLDHAVAAAGIDDRDP